MAALTVSCSSATKLTTSLKSPDVQPKKFGKLEVLTILPAMSNRATIETAVEAQLKVQGINGRATFDMFPLAGNRELMQRMMENPEQLKATVREKVTQNKIDGLLIISLLDTTQEERYVEGASFSIAVPG